MKMVSFAEVKSAIDEAGIEGPAKTALLSAVERSLAPLPDTWVYRLVVLALGVAIFVPLIAVLMGKDIEIMKLLLPIATGALGALAGLLAPSPVTNR